MVKKKSTYSEIVDSAFGYTESTNKDLVGGIKTRIRELEGAHTVLLLLVCAFTR